MGFVKKSSKIALTGLVIAGMMMSSCAEMQGSSSGGGTVKKVKDGIHDAEHMAREAWDWATGTPPKLEREQAKETAEAVANWPKTLSNVNIKGIPKKYRQCYKAASALSGVPLPVMYAITMNETGFHDHSVDANGNLEGKSWDCGMMQDNTYWTVCPVAYRLANNMTVYWFHQYDEYHSGLIEEIKALGLKYLGGGSSKGNCDNLTHAETVEYCRELEHSPAWVSGVRESLGPRITPDPVCLSIFMGAYVLSKKMWHLKYDSSHYDTVLSDMKKYSGGGAYEYAIKHGGKYFIWVMTAYAYNGVTKCYGAACYYNKFIRHLKELF